MQLQHLDAKCNCSMQLEDAGAACSVLVQHAGAACIFSMEIVCNIQEQHAALACSCRFSLWIGSPQVRRSTSFWVTRNLGDHHHEVKVLPDSRMNFYVESPHATSFTFLQHTRGDPIHKFLDHEERPQNSRKKRVPKLYVTAATSVALCSAAAFAALISSLPVIPVASLNSSTTP